MKKLTTLVVLALVPFANAQASPVEFTFQSTITSNVIGSIAGVSIGDTVAISLFADNGSSSLLSQSWTIGSLNSGSLAVGSYFQNYVDGWFDLPSFTIFQTDATGNLVTADFVGTTYSPNHSDSFGTGGNVRLYNGGLQDYFGNTALFSPRQSQSPSNWTVTAAIPEPETYAMLLAGLGLLGFAARRRKQKELAA